MAVDARRLFIGILAMPPVKFMRIIWSTRDEAGPERRRVVVIGAGVVGVMSAYGLSRRGFEVTVLDAMSGPAEMCSQGNAGIMAIGHAKAWAGPDALPAMVKAFAGRDPSVKISRLNDPALWWWGTEFLANCTSTAHHRNTEALQRLSRYSRDLLLDAQIKMDLPMEVRSNGGLYIFQDQAQFESYKASIQKYGNDELTVLERDELISREAGLSGFSDRLVGGIYSASDAVGDCRLFTERTVAYLENSKGVEFRFGTAVTGFRCSAKAVEAVKTNQGEIECGAVVLATGVETCDLTRLLGFSPNIYPVKGYSGTWKVTDPTGLPNLPYVDETELLAVATYGGRLRVTAIAEFVGRDRSLRTDRTAYIADYVKRSFGSAVDLSAPSFWAGLRPTTPAGPPFLGRVRKFNNLWINAGHGQLGWTMAMGCGELLSQKINGEPIALQNVSATANWLS
ncbi:FAD-dependent oxidoreductase [Brucella anthropi]|uniref:FAD-dependent oxidoreductase n=1 Tax=Brucella anthropi TaxID=529 RepID=A0A6L3YZ62_BRUAN|nr:FAD-dependent oxidoreductase [Brucella anthropi]KAB2759582.1 FAD-dependent oxidoreductase [Brucella anthropi]